ncbi:hypothetical protein B0H14DRAFT_2621896 [Mycena olivaceomarginata]|nr:hypothetical protein B0H14DRAFT_2621896 [Mycena olivaceomarginata]
MPRDFVRVTMKGLVSQGPSDMRQPGWRKGQKKRSALNAIGIFQEIHVDGHEKLGEKALRMGAVGHIFLEMVSAFGAISVQVTFDGGSELGWLAAFRTTLREIFAPELSPEEWKPVVAVQSSSNIPIESTWSYDRKFNGRSIREVLKEGRIHLIPGDVVHTDPAFEVSKAVHISRARGVNEVPAVYSGGSDTFATVPGSFSDWRTSIFGASQPGGNEPFGTLAGIFSDWSATGLGSTYPLSNEPFGTVPGNYYDWKNYYIRHREHRCLRSGECAIIGSRWPAVGRAQTPPTFDKNPDKRPFPQRISNEWEITGERPRGRGKQYEVSENGRKLGWFPGALLKGSEVLFQSEEAQVFAPGDWPLMGFEAPKDSVQF